MRQLTNHVPASTPLPCGAHAKQGEHVLVYGVQQKHQTNGGEYPASLRKSIAQ